MLRHAFTLSLAKRFPLSVRIHALAQQLAHRVMRQRYILVTIIIFILSIQVILRILFGKLNILRCVYLAVHFGILGFFLRQLGFHQLLVLGKFLLGLT